MTRGVKRKYEPSLAMLMSSVPPYPGPRTLADMVWDRHFGEPLRRAQRWFRSRARRSLAWGARQIRVEEVNYLRRLRRWDLTSFDGDDEYFARVTGHLR